MWCQLQRCRSYYQNLIVVICLKSCIFVVSITTRTFFEEYEYLL
ncbi:small protein A-like protein [Prevotella nigrescens ATCC 33563]|nr:small protein A-like protein [Prevotella nigrescens ATCC 33563]